MCVCVCVCVCVEQMMTDSPQLMTYSPHITLCMNTQHYIYVECEYFVAVLTAKQYTTTEVCVLTFEFRVGGWVLCVVLFLTAVWSDTVRCGDDKDIMSRNS
jgi:hypothetical protein